MQSFADHYQRTVLSTVPSPANASSMAADVGFQLSELFPCVLRKYGNDPPEYWALSNLSAGVDKGALGVVEESAAIAAALGILLEGVVRYPSSGVDVTVSSTRLAQSSISRSSSSDKSFALSVELQTRFSGFGAVLSVRMPLSGRNCCLAALCRQ